MPGTFIDILQRSVSQIWQANNVELIENSSDGGVIKIKGMPGVSVHQEEGKESLTACISGNYASYIRPYSTVSHSCEGRLFFLSFKDALNSPF